MPERVNVNELRDILAIEKCEPDASLVCVLIPDLAALLDVAEAARQLLNELDDAIAGADLTAWDAPYMIPAPSFRAGGDAVRAALSGLEFGDTT